MLLHSLSRCVALSNPMTTVVRDEDSQFVTCIDSTVVFRRIDYLLFFALIMETMGRSHRERSSCLHFIADFLDKDTGTGG